MNFDCGECLVANEHKSFDLVIIDSNNFHLGKYCDFACLQKDVEILSKKYKSESNNTKNSENASLLSDLTMLDIESFFLGEQNSSYEYLLPSHIIINPATIDLLNQVFHKSSPILQTQILCYWISCVEPSANGPNVDSFEKVRLPKTFLNGAKISTDDNMEIVVVNGDPVSGDNNFVVKIKDKIHYVSPLEVVFQPYSVIPKDENETAGSL